MTTELTLVDKISQEVGIPLTDAEKIVGAFSEVANSIKELDTELVEFNKHEEITKEVSEQAREIRLKFVKVRTKGDEIHKTIKETYLLRTRAIDGVRNIYKLKIAENETKLKDIELHFERIEQAEKDKKNAERELALSKYVADVSLYNYKEMNDEVFTNMLLSAKKVWEAEQEVIKQAELDRIENEKKLEAEREAQRLENIKLKKEAEEREAELAKEREAKEAELEAERLKAKKIADEMQKKADEDAKEKARLQKEIDDKKAEDDRLKKEADAKAQADELARLKAEKQAELAPDKDKMKKYAVELGCLEVPKLQSDEAKKTLAKALDLVSQAINLLKI